MKKNFLPLLVLSLAGIVIFLSCKKEVSCESCREGNKAPIAVAGPDKLVTLPNDSVSLDGDASSDPDGTITEWLWKKISGPASFNINNTASTKTVAKNLIAGTYLFELKVTDNGGLSAKDTLQVIVNAVPINHSPVANAGADQTINLPTNTINLDGSATTDPDHNITSYLWTKISGPSSFNIANANSVQTQVTNLVEGVYQFELKVTDAGGLFSKDTLQVTVNEQLPSPGTLCSPANRPFFNYQITSVGTLSIARTGMAVVSSGNKIFFAGGTNSNISGFYSRVDIYDIGLQAWSRAELSKPRTRVCAVASGNKVFFAGGYENSGNTSARVDIYNLTTQTWSTAELSQPRSDIVTATVGNKVFFAGGRFSSNYSSSTNVYDKIDIYDIATNSWSIASLSESRIGFTAVTADNKVYFAGGYSGGDLSPALDKIDIYDNATDSWTVSALNAPRAFHAGIFKNGKIYWAGGASYIDDVNGDHLMCQVEIKDINTQNLTFSNLFEPREYTSVFEKDNKIIFIYELWYPTQVNFEVYDISTDSWSQGVPKLSLPYNSGVFISANNTIYVAGGLVNGFIYNQVWKLEF